MAFKAKLKWVISKKASNETVLSTRTKTICGQLNQKKKLIQASFDIHSSTSQEVLLSRSFMKDSSSQDLGTVYQENMDSCHSKLDIIRFARRCQVIFMNNTENYIKLLQIPQTSIPNTKVSKIYQVRNLTKFNSSLNITLNQNRESQNSSLTLQKGTNTS